MKEKMIRINPKRIWKSAGRCAVLLSAAFAGGCGSSPSPHPVSPEQFYIHRGVGETALSATDHPGPIAGRDVRSEPAPPPLAEGARSEAINPTVQEVVSATTQPSLQPSLQPSISLSTTEPSTQFSAQLSTQPSELASTEPVYAGDQYMTLGAVVANVAGTPIYANKMLQLDTLQLRSLARQYDQRQYEIAARSLLEKTISELINNELEIAAAQATLDDKDKEQAKFATTAWSAHQVTEAGGSVELAKRKFLAEGKDFKDAENDQYRSFLQQLYYMRKIDPRIQVTAADERDYYNKHLDPEFSQPDKADFRMIFCSASKHQGDDARARLEDIRSKAARGTDFTALAKDEATNDYHPDNGGWVETSRNSFALTKVEEAVWQLKVGEISPVIEDRNGFYLVKLFEVDKGVTRPFDDPAVQTEIHEKLYRMQLMNLRGIELDRLKAAQGTRYEPSMLDPVMEMAMQNYARWSQGK